MSAYAGSSLVVTWVQAAATTTLTGDHRNLTLTPSINLVESTAGPDADRTYIPNVKSYTATFDAVFQSGTNSGGTTTFSTCNLGNIGTLNIKPEGTASTKPNIALPAISQGVSYAFPYQDVVSVTINFQSNGALSETANS